MSNKITEQLDEIVVKELNRASIADGKLLNYYVLTPLNDRDSVLAKYFDTLSANVYYNDDGTDNIYHYANDAKNFNVRIKSDATLSAFNIIANNTHTNTITAVNTTATEVTATNYTATSTSATSLSATSDKFYVNMSSLGQGYTDKMKFVDVVDKVQDRGEDVNEIISNNENVWSSLSAIKVDNHGTTVLLTPKVLKFEKSNNVDFSFSNKCLTIGCRPEENPATVSNGVLIFTNF